jgi:hypothetical protein
VPATPGGSFRGSTLGPLAVGMAAALVLVVTAMNVALPERPQGSQSQDTPARTAPVGSEDIVPLTASVRSHVWLAGCGHRYLVDRPPARVPAPPSPQDAGQWATGLGAVHGGSTIVEAIVRGEGSGAVVVEALYVRITEREQPLDWPAYEMSMGCGGSLTPAAFTVALDAGRPLARPRGGFDGESGEAGIALPAPELPYQVTQNEPLVLRVEAAAEDCDCRWFLELEWSSGAERGTLRIDDNGEPFRTSGIPSEAVHVYPHGSGGWEPE